MPPDSVLPPMPVIVGAPRSGTTLLRLMLDAHPHLAIPPESGFLPAALRLQRRGRVHPEAVFRAVVKPDDPQAWNDFGIPGERYLATLRALSPFSVAEGCRAFYRLYADRFGKSRWGEKTPLYCQWMPEVEQVLPEVHFIHIIRDGRAVAHSLRGLWFAPGYDMTVLATHWAGCVTAARMHGHMVRHYLEVRYELLVASPEAVLEEVCAYLDLPFDYRMLRYFVGAPARLAEYGARRLADGREISHEARVAQQALVMEPPRTSRISAWTHELTRAERAEFEGVGGGLLRELGYRI